MFQTVAMNDSNSHANSRVVRDRPPRRWRAGGVGLPVPSTPLLLRGAWLLLAFSSLGPSSPRLLGAADAAPRSRRPLGSRLRGSTPEGASRNLLWGKGKVKKNIADLEKEIEDLQAEIEVLGAEGGAAEEDKEQMEALEEAMIESTFPEGCSWQCYLARYKGLVKNLKHTEEAALRNWIKHGQAGNKTCSCDGVDLSVLEVETRMPVPTNIEVMKQIEKVEDEVEELDAKDGELAEEEKEDLEALEVAMVETTFPKGCSWKCYLARYKGLSNHIRHDKKAALRHWVNHGQAQNKTCSCEGVDLSVLEAAPEEGDVVANQGVLDEIAAVEQEVEDLGDQEGAAAVAEKKNLEALEEAMIAATFPQGCSWKCYLTRYKGLMKNLKHTEEAALRNWVKHGQDQNRTCTCEGVDLSLLQAELGPPVDVDEAVLLEIKKVEVEVEVLGTEDGELAEEEKENLEALEEAMIESTFPEDCSWKCYLARYKGLMNNLEHTEVAALRNWINHGEAAGKSCLCEGVDAHIVDSIVEDPEGDESNA